MLLSIREEIAEAWGRGPDRAAAATRPARRVVPGVHRFLQRQSHRPSIKRYLQLDEIQRALGGCHSSLTDPLGMFIVRRVVLA